MTDVRPAQAPDAVALAAIYRPYVEDTAISFEEQPPSAEQMLDRMHAAPRLPWLVAERDSVVVGYAYASSHRARAAYRWSVDVSVYIRHDQRRRGTGRALYSALLPALRQLGYVSAFAGIALPNPASVALHEAIGFRPVGVYSNVGFKLGAWHDVGWWQTQLADPPSRPAAPAGWSAEPDAPSP